MKTHATPSHCLNLDIQIFDTDCYGVMWHGAYTKWLEMGRVNLLRSLGIDIAKPDDTKGYIYPVVDQHFRFRAPAKFGDVLTLTTTLDVQGHKLIFHQTCQDNNTNKTTLEATTTCILVDQTWRPQRKMPAFITNALTQPV